MFNFSAKDFELVRFFSYTSVVPSYKDNILTIDTNVERYYPNLCRKFDIFYQELRDMATNLVKEKTGKDIYFFFGDNKTVFQIMNKRTRQIYFISKYDFHRAIGRACLMYFGYIYDFRLMEKSEYFPESGGLVKCADNRLWKEFNPFEKIRI